MTDDQIKHMVDEFLDPKCHDLAKEFLAGESAELNNEKGWRSLAIEIKSTIEDEIIFMKMGIFND